MADDDNIQDDKRTVVNSIKTPSFCPQRVTLWFAQLEAQFAIHGIVKEKSKFNHAVSLIDTQHAHEVESLIINPPKTKPYQQLKTTLIQCYSQSEEAKLRQLLDGEAIGERSPSQFLRHLKSLVPNVDEAVLKTKWMSGLPEQTRALLAVQTSASLDDQCKTADKLHEIMQGHVAAAQVSTSPAQSIVEQQLSALTLQVETLTKRFDQKQRGRSESRSSVSPRRRSQSRKRINNVTGICWYHTKFGNEAYLCVPGCKFQGNASPNH